MQCEYPPYAHGRKAIADSSKITFGELAREYLELNKPNWEEWPASNAENLIETHLVAGILAVRSVVDLEFTEAKPQRFINQYVERGSSSSLLSKLVRYTRAVLNIAMDRRLIEINPARKLKARSKKKVWELHHTLEECDALIALLSGRDRLHASSLSSDCDLKNFLCYAGTTFLLRP